MSSGVQCLLKFLSHGEAQPFDVVRSTFLWRKLDPIVDQILPAERYKVGAPNPQLPTRLQDVFWRP